MTRRLRGYAFWSAFEAGFAALCSFGGAITIARIVGPAEMGVGAAALAPHLLLWIGVNALFADALVQRSTLDETEMSSAFWAACFAGLAAAAVQAAAGPPLAAAIGDARLVPMALLLALPLPLVGAGGVAQGLLTRRRAYRALAARALAGQGLGALAGVGAALFGAGAWALVAQQGVCSVAGALALLARAGWRPGRVLRWPAVAALLRTGLPLVGATLVQNGRYRVFAMLIGATAGPAALGLVHLAFRLADAVRDLATTACWRLMLPAMAARQSDVPALQACVDRYALMSGMVMFPLAGAMLVSIRPFVRLALGPAWEPAGTATAPLLLLLAWLFLGFAGGVASVARGGARYALVFQAIAAAATVGGALLIRPATPDAAAWTWFGAQLLGSPYLMRRTAGLMQAGPLRQLRAGLVPLALAAAATGVALLVPGSPFGGRAGDAGLIAARLAVLLIVYGAGVALLLGGRVRAVLRPAPDQAGTVPA